MKKTLENLWYTYQIEHPFEQNDEKKKFLNILVKEEENLHKSLNEEEIEMLERYDNCLNEIRAISECEAFIAGIRFATQYLIEATSFSDKQ